jgi:hypothetical protein
MTIGPLTNKCVTCSVSGGDSAVLGGAVVRAELAGNVFAF